MKVLKLIPCGLINDEVITTNSEKSAEVVVGRNAEGRNKVKWQLVFKPDASTLSLIGDGAIKTNQSVESYIN